MTTLDGTRVLPVGAVELRAPSSADVNPPPPALPTWFCRNCALAFDEPFCSACGQHLKTADLLHTNQEVQGIPDTDTPHTSQTKGL